jgi:hypothetical protein
MSQQPPPQVSPDGRFYWDGERWVPFQQPIQPVQPVQPVAGQKQSHTGRNVALGCLGVLIVGGIIALAAAGGSHGNAATLNWDVEGRHTGQSVVGGSDAFQVTVTNHGSDASELILYVNSADNWLKHHVVTDPGGCTLNSSLERLECGPIKAGETRTINVAGSPKDAGNFNFAVDVADQEGSTLLYPKLGELTWSEAITAG